MFYLEYSAIKFNNHSNGDPLFKYGSDNDLTKYTPKLALDG